MGKKNGQHAVSGNEARLLHRVEEARIRYAKAEERIATLRMRLARAEGRLARRTERLARAEEALVAFSIGQHSNSEQALEQTTIVAAAPSSDTESTREPVKAASTKAAKNGARPSRSRRTTTPPKES